MGKGGAVVRRAAALCLVWGAAILSVFPFVWMVIGATNSSAEITKGRLTPGPELWANFMRLNGQTDLPLIFWNSSKIALLSAILAVIIASLAGYGFEVFRSRFRERLYQLLLITMMVPFAALMIPLFLLSGYLGLIDTHAGVIAPTAASAYLVFYFRQSSKAFPSELREAARVDGLKEWQIFLFIFVPVMRSTFAAAFVIAFLTAWNSFLWPLIVLQSPETKTITLLLSSLGSAYFPDYGVIMVATALATLPTLVVFFAMQRQFVQGLLGSIK
ncbi:carbohydrate ABC transporter permease [Niveibacterium sp. SC-1]|uniref:carbohydrate ABC transporter permease n=1 Tax=Niveibacterium sp. SC-1 TaxID=3135646 RepID=UPI00311D7536